MSEHPTVLVRMSPELVAELSKGNSFQRWEFGEPDGEGFYSPIVVDVARCPDCDELPVNRIHHDRTLKAYHPFGGAA